ncbi:esterase/lipase family protein [Thermomonospora amylolytica]|uniref:esterase/lipase family protein n=1 Tax=Thermomonospora amylolytica TaxID=1411117 RepID=UPI000E6C5E6F|nr:triacylglycerol lipase [Thermomonospora amylolytica]
MSDILAATAAGALLLLPMAAPVQAATAFDPATSNPILFVHGYSSNGSVWNTMAGRFANDGWPSSHLDQWSYDYRQSNATTASRLAQEVDRLLAATGAAKVDVVTHSMGGLSSRYYAKNLGGGGKIDAWVSLGGPNHGTDAANSCFDASCTEMRIGSSFLTALNSGDETPGDPRYATWWSPCDAFINPDTSTALNGASNTRTACLSHTALTTDATVYEQVRDHVNR